MNTMFSIYLSLLALVINAPGRVLGDTVDAPHLTSRQASGDCLLSLPDLRGGFTERRVLDFSKMGAGDDAAEYLGSFGFGVSNYPVPSRPVARDFRRENVRLGDGTLDLHVNAYVEKDGSVHSAEFLTEYTFKYASVRTVLKSSRTPGVVQGNFFFLNDNQEIDFEILTSTITNSSPCLAAGIWAVNQPLVAGQSSTSQPVLLSFDPADDFHEYRIDWSANATTFYIDGEQVAILTTNVPTEAGRWIWNAWSSGDPCWSNGPPQADSVTHIRSIDIFTGYSESATSCPANTDGTSTPRNPMGTATRASALPPASQTSATSAPTTPKITDAVKPGDNDAQQPPTGAASKTLVDTLLLLVVATFSMAFI